MFRNARNHVSESSKFQACWEHPEKACYPSKSKVFKKKKDKKSKVSPKKKQDKTDVDCCNFCWMSTRLKKGFLTHIITNLCCFF